ncbi:hypothetical protein [Paucibacter soli]|uniref:hypothetical protein n=1 Tax=Paucibacter soli TaxID=3133433 RepID=UPI0030B614B9
MNPANSPAPIVKVTLLHTLGAVSGYKPGEALDPDRGGIKEAIITCAATYGDGPRGDLLRSDLPGSAWSRIEAEGAFPELQAILTKGAIDLLDGHIPQVVVTLDGKAISGAELITSDADVVLALQDPTKRALPVPRLLPFQLGGSADGAIGVLYSPNAGGGIKLHSMHSTLREAHVAEEILKQAGEQKTGQLNIVTPVTKLIAAAMSGNYKPLDPSVIAAVVQRAGASEAARQHPGLMPSPLSMVPPSPFAQN